MLVAVLVASLCLVPPVNAPVVEAFDAPACPYCAGHRTIDYASGAGQPVVAPIAGRIAFAGEVAGRRYVSIRSGEHTVTVGGLGPLAVAAGAIVAAGQVVGLSRSSGAGARPALVTLSLRRDVGESVEHYLDPGPYLAHRVGRARLVPTDGTRPRRTAARTRLVCPAGR